MNEKNFAGFLYKGLTNLGDNIQSVATETLLPKIITRFNRDTLALADWKDDILLVMNGWFSHNPEMCLPQSQKIHPIFWGFHITDWNTSWDYFSRKSVIDYLKSYEPIGCRDPYTAERLSKLGIETFVSYCLTLTLPCRNESNNANKIILVDVPQLLLPPTLKEQAYCCTHYIPGNLREAIKRIYATNLLNRYKHEAKLVITSRLHCLLPCIAMGIPVVFFNKSTDYRVSWVKELGVNIYDTNSIEKVDWNQKPINFESKKRELINSFFIHIGAIKSLK